MIKKTKNLIIVLISLGLILPTFGYAYYSPAIEFKANGLDTPVAISYNTPVTLTWTSTNSSSCDASGDWSGTKPLWGSESVGNLTSSKTFIITCRGPDSSATAQMVINVVNTTSSSSALTINKLVRNVTDGTSYSDSVLADPTEIVSFSIQVTTGNTSLQNIIIKDTLPNKISYLGNLKINGTLYTGNITSGFNIGDLSANQIKTITFDAGMAGPALFNLGETTLVNTALAYNNLVAVSDSAKIIVSKKTGGVITVASTGLTNSLFLDSFFLPLAITILMVWLFKSRIIKFEEWLDSRKEEYRKYRTQKLLQMKIAKIKTQEFLQKNKNK